MSVDWYPWLTLNGNWLTLAWYFNNWNCGWQSVESQLIFADMHAIVHQTDQCISAGWQSTDYWPTVYGVLIRCNRDVVWVSSDCWLSVNWDATECWPRFWLRVNQGHEWTLMAMDAFSSHDWIIVPCLSSLRTKL